MEKLYTYVDLRLHPYMFSADEYPSLHDFFRNMFTAEKHVLEDIEVDDVYEGCRRQWEEYVADWEDEHDNEFAAAFDMYVRSIY